MVFVVDNRKKKYLEELFFLTSIPELYSSNHDLLYAGNLIYFFFTYSKDNSCR
jgi:hypothetical protein